MTQAPITGRHQSRIGLTATTTLAIFSGLFCLIWYAARSIDYGEEMFLFLTAATAQFVTTACSLILGRTWKRWLLLLLAIPCLLLFADRFCLLVKVLTTK